MSVTHLLSKASGNPNLDNVFDPYVQGTNPGTIDLLNDAGVDLSQSVYAPLVYGSAAAATGLLSAATGGDLNTLFAAKGTAVYSLPINGQTFLAAAASATGACSANIDFSASTSGWSVTGSSSSGGHVDTASGSLPSGAVSVQYSYTLTTSVGNGSVTNGASSVTTLTGSNVSIAVVANSPSPSSADNERHATVVIKFYNSSSAVISTTTIYLNAQAEGTA